MHFHEFVFPRGHVRNWHCCGGQREKADTELIGAAGMTEVYATGDNPDVVCNICFPKKSQQTQDNLHRTLR